MESQGTLYIVSTPIGNMEDITLRALRILKQVDIIAAEDTRNTGKLLSYHNIKNSLISCHEHNEQERSDQFIEKLNKGYNIALLSDAGTPSISDPGYRIVKKAIANNIKIVPIPGVSAAITALSVSGLPTDSFIFAGFPPKKKGKLHEWLKDLEKEKRSIIFYESPKRVINFLKELKTVMGDRCAVLSREMTKVYEEFIREKLSEIILILEKKESIKGECTIVVKGNQDAIVTPWNIIEDEILTRLKQNEKPSIFIKEMAKQYSLSKNMLYDKALQLKHKIE